MKESLKWLRALLYRLAEGQDAEGIFREIKTRAPEFAAALHEALREGSKAREQVEHMAPFPIHFTHDLFPIVGEDGKKRLVRVEDW